MMTYDVDITKGMRTLLVVDGENIFHMARKMGMSIDYSKLRSMLDSDAEYLRSYFYSSSSNYEKDDRVYKFHDMLKNNGFKLVEFDNSVRRVNSQLIISLDTYRRAVEGDIEHVIIMSGNGDFVKLVESLQEKGIMTTVIYSKEYGMSYELRLQVDAFHDICTLGVTSPLTMI